MTKQRAKPLTADNQPMLKMKQLVDMTGVAKSTILLYTRKGLLPRPVKTSPNMAYYHPDCINRIAFIKQVQARHRLPLAAIKGLIKEMEKGRDITALLELQSLLFGSGTEKLNTDQFCQSTGLTREQVETLCSLKLLTPLEPGRFDDQDQAVGLQLRHCMALGIDPGDLTFYPDLAQIIVEKEIRLRQDYTRHLNYKENAALTLEMTRLARGLRGYIIDRTLQKRLIEFKGLNPKKNLKKNKNHLKKPEAS
ncbi:MAG: MerR family transcriptional regulator [Desulfobacterales bacterium]|nr:MerR family transcriptional regulator [Desulfobacterales bacterium]